MSVYKIFKETSLPGTLQANSIYLIAPAARPDFVEVYVTGTSASVVKRVIDAEHVQDMIDTSIAGMNSIEVVANITARNALNPTSNIQVLVLDATGDNTVASGAAIGAQPQCGPLYLDLGDAPVFVNPGEFIALVGEFIALVGKFIVGTATASQTITFTYTPIYGWE